MKVTRDLGIGACLRLIVAGIGLAGVLISAAMPIYANSDVPPKMGQFIGAKTATHPDWFKASFLDFGEDIDEASAQGKRLVLYFWQEGCPYCNQLWEHNMAVAGIEDKFKANFDVVAINMWGDEEVISVGGKSFSEKQLARALRVNFTPTLIFYNERKKPALRLNGYYPPPEFDLALDYVKDKQEDVLPFAEYKLAALTAAKEGAGPATLAHWQDYFKSADQIPNLVKNPGDRPLAVLFEAPDCEGCDLLHEKTLADADTRALFQRMDVVQLNVLDKDKINKPDGETTTAAQWATQLGLAYFPSIVFFDQQGQMLVQMDSALRSFHIQSIIAYVAQKAYLTEPDFQRFISARADHLREQGIDVDIWRY